ncbi:MAG: hypothetical protein KDA60_13395 [Planctomycetales bacterium]|nr:hypothetical protein [Planctomycetales bacterium]
MAMNQRLYGSLVVLGLAVGGCGSDQGPALRFTHVERGPAAEATTIWPEPGSPARVFIFVRTDCPIANRCAPEIKSLREGFGDVAEFVLVYCSERESMSQIADHAAEFYDSQIPVLRDGHHELVAACSVSTTPEAVVYDNDGQLIYRGRIDDRYVDFGETRAEPTKRDLLEVLVALRSRQPVSFRETRAIGCPLTPLPTDVEH